jgi:hypothetical protein
MLRMSDTPAQVSDYVRAAVEYVRRAIGVLLDGSEESLAVLDHYVGQVPRDRPEMIELLAPAVGAYFGEVVRRRFGGSWKVAGAPATWRLAITRAHVVIAPIAMAAAALAGAEVEGYDTTLVVPKEREEQLLDALERTAPVTEEYFYSLTGRFESLQHTLDLLGALRHAGE